MIHVSIIVATFNAEATLARCIDSVAEQTLAGIELIIIDGGSNDCTASIIAGYGDLISHWISEPDRGIYDAMNKGIEHAGGEWILFLGADDRLHAAHTLEQALLSARDEVDLIAGPIEYDTGARFIPSFDRSIYLRNSLHHQGVLYRRRLFSQFRYDPGHHISGDYELNLKLFVDGARAKLLDQTLATCAAMGASHLVNRAGYDEEIAIRSRLLRSKPLLCALLNLATRIRYQLKKWLTAQH